MHSCTAKPKVIFRHQMHSVSNLKQWWLITFVLPQTNFDINNYHEVVYLSRKDKYTHNGMT